MYQWQKCRIDKYAMVQPSNNLLDYKVPVESYNNLVLMSVEGSSNNSVQEVKTWNWWVVKTGRSGHYGHNTGLGPDTLG